MKFTHYAIPILLIFTNVASSATEPSAPDGVENVLVTGEQPGPGLWKVTKGDHTLWIMGSLGPLPRKMTWRSREVERVIAQSQEILAAPEIKPQIGFFRAVTLLPAALKARKNPDGAQLKDILSASQYSQWSTLKAQYLGTDSGIEEWRPMFAAQKLYSKALERSELSNKDIVWPVVEDLGKKYHVTISRTRVGVPVDDPKSTIKEFSETPRDLDIACMQATLDRLEADVATMKTLANAWSTGDVAKLRNLSMPKQYKACLAAFAATPRLEQMANKLIDDVENDWLTRAEIALNKNQNTFTVLPIAELFSDEGRPARLKANGYEVTGPQ
jgi:uncharacterized protein YbaP (TraB family)